MPPPVIGHLVLFAATALPLAAQSVELLPELVVLADRRNDAGSETPIASWDRDDLRVAAPRTLDELLDQEPSFSLYRRQTAIFGNPSSAGVSLRNTGATAASRTLVLLDGIPQNDPFGGWIYWARYDAATLDSVRIVPSARTAVWGNQSPAGVIQMNANAPFQNRSAIGAGAGSFGTARGSLLHQATNAEGAASVSISAFGLHSDGFHAVSPSQRGTVDRKLWIDLWGADLKAAFLAAPGLTIEPMLSYYTEERGNGTALSGNSSDALDAALRVSSDDARVSWQALGYYQRREFESRFAAVADDRNSETLALDQFDVPGRGSGGAFTAMWDHGDQWSFTAGADTRFVTGETNEQAGTFRLREAGGKQAFAGLFAATGCQPDDATRIDTSARLDFWQLTDGRRTETSPATGDPLRADTYPDRAGFEPSASLELSRELHDDLEARFSAGTGFRLPTLNELHRPYRVRTDVVEANPALDPERFISIEAGADWQAASCLKLRASVFHHWINDAIANVPVTDPAEISEIFGELPPGGTGSQKRNVEQAQVTGVEAGIEWQAREDLLFDLVGLWSDTEFGKSPEQPLLAGMPFPQAPELHLIANASWQATGQLSFFATCEYGSSQFDDALASRQLPDYTRVHIGASWRAGSTLYQIRADNLFNEQITTGLASNGIRTLAAPRSLWIGADWEF